MEAWGTLLDVVATTGLTIAEDCSVFLSLVGKHNNWRDFYCFENVMVLKVGVDKSLFLLYNPFVHKALYSATLPC